MTTTQVILWCICGIGVILACIALFQMFTTKGETKRSTLALLAAGQMLITPQATFNLLTESCMLWKFIFVFVLLPGLIAVHNLSKNEK